uniref:Periplasmic beta-glucosidase n=1 Tax=uncultured bacterium contig00097 TaxID=1181566 RepID=A0A806K1C8_9BACT|nr:periplasmic beta-glucosidase [uncultured bacterium contig00097]
MRRIFAMTALALLACVFACKKSADAEMDSFVSKLMKQMTLEEKIGQLYMPAVGFNDEGPILSEEVKEKFDKGLIGGVLDTYENAFTPKAAVKMQDLAMDKSRLKIPLLFGFDVIHGHRTIFPIPLGLSASWDMDLIKRTAQIAAGEAAADGLHWTFSPMVDIARDPRWGRVAEGAGEDPYLGGEVARALVQGYQQGDLGNPKAIMACVKHFGLYGASEAGRDYNTTDMSRIRMYNEYLPPYKAAIDAGVATAMTSFNEIDGMPATGNKWLLTDLLRGQWGFSGFVVTDYNAIAEMEQHGVGDSAKVAELAINAGSDMDMVSARYLDELPALVKSGKVKEATINAACRRILEAKYKLGLFNDPYRGIRATEDAEPAEQILAPEALALSKEAAVKSMVLLKNDKEILPLNPSKRIAFIGPLVQNQRDLIGNWSGVGDWRQAVSLWSALEEKYGKGKFLYSLGCNLVDDPALRNMLNSHRGNLTLDSKSPQQLISEAVQVAQRADVVVAVLGESQGMSGEAASRTNIQLLDNQAELLKALKKTGKPVVLVLMNGRPLALQWEHDNLDAILETWFAGTQAGHAIADVLFGDANPSGKLTISFPRNAGQIPIFYNHKNTGRPFVAVEKSTSRYLDAPNEPLYPFGFGLGYSAFEYSDVALSATEMTMKGSIEASVTVSNTGQYAGEEIVQLYIRDLVGSTTRPVKELKGFKKIALKPGERTEVKFVITPDMLAFYNADLRFAAEPGDFHVFIGESSATNNKADFKLK